VDTVKNIDQRRLGRMSLPVDRLPLAEVLSGVGEMGTQTCQHKSLEHLGDCYNARFVITLSLLGPQDERYNEVAV